MLRLAHSNSGHFGVGTTRSIISKAFTWPNVSADVQTFVNSCEKCQMYSRSNPPQAPLSEPEVITERFERLALDVIGPLERSKSGYAYILTGMDLATSYPFAFPMKSCTAIETAENCGDNNCGLRYSS